MENLPLELLDVIARQCDHASQKRMRLATKQLNEAATPLVFEHFYIGLFEHHLQRLEGLVASGLAKYVKHFSFWSDILPDFTAEQYESNIDLRPKFQVWRNANIHESDAFRHNFDCIENCHAAFSLKYTELPKHSLTKADLERGYDRYNSYRQSQNTWTYATHSQRFCDAFSRLPKLRSASLLFARPFEGHRNDLPVWKRLSKDIYIGPDNWMFLKSHVARDPTTHRPSSCAQDIAAVCFINGLAARHRLQPQESIATLLLEYGEATLTDQTKTAHPSRIVRGPDYWLDVHGAFSQLRMLTLNQCHWKGALDPRGLVEQTVSCLRAAHDLRHLDLTFVDDEHMDSALSRAPLSLLFTGASKGGMSWPHLERLILTTHLSSTQDFLDFLQQHKNTLKSLELRDMLLGTSVCEALEAIPKILKLDHVYVECVWDQEDADSDWYGYIDRGTDDDGEMETNLKQYLLGQRAEMPDISPEESDWDGGMLTQMPDDDDDDEQLSDLGFNEDVIEG